MKRLTERKLEKMEALIKKGLSQVAVARVVGVSPATVAYHTPNHPLRFKLQMIRNKRKFPTKLQMTGVDFRSRLTPAAVHEPVVKRGRGRPRKVVAA